MSNIKKAITLKDFKTLPYFLPYCLPNEPPVYSIGIPVFSI